MRAIKNILWAYDANINVNSKVIAIININVASIKVYDVTVVKNWILTIMSGLI